MSVPTPKTPSSTDMHPPGLSSRGKKWSKAEDKQLEQELASSISIAEIAKLHNRSALSIEYRKKHIDQKNYKTTDDYKTSKSVINRLNALEFKVEKLQQAMVKCNYNISKLFDRTMQ
jgi:hypothetical protein